MKTITEMTDAEILKLTDEQLETLVKLRMAQEGVKIIAEPAKPNYLPIPPGDVQAYEVGGFQYDFTSQDKALAASQFILELKGDLRDSSSGRHYELKYLTDDFYSSNSIGQIQPKKYYSRELIAKIEDDFSANEKLKKSYQAALKEYNENAESAKYLRDEVYDKYNEVFEKHGRMERIKSLFNEYLDLADGDEDTAMKFLKKAYSIDAETEQFILPQTESVTAN